MRQTISTPIKKINTENGNDSNENKQFEKNVKTPDTQERTFFTDDKMSKSSDCSSKIVKIEIADYMQSGETNKSSLTNYIPTNRKADIMKQSISPGVLKMKTTYIMRQGRKNEQQQLDGQILNTQESLLKLQTQPQIDMIQPIDLMNVYSSDNQIHKKDVKQPVSLVIKKTTKIIRRIERFKYNNQIVYPPFIVPVKSKFKRVWDTIITAILFWNILYLPWELAFPEDTIPQHNYFLLTVYSLDLIISSRTTYYNQEQDEVIGDREIILKYIQNPYFILDLLSIIPFDIIDQSKRASSSSLAFLKFLKLIRLLRLTRIISRMNGEEFQVAGTIIKYLFVLLLVLHWEALLWWALVNSEDENADGVYEANTWLPIIYHVLDNSSQFDANQIAKDMAIVGIIPSHVKYLFTLYSMIMLILGGEVTPLTTLQGFEATFFAFIGQLTFAIIFANMSKALFQIRQQFQQLQTTMEQFDKLAKQLRLPKSTNDGIQEYIQFCFNKKIIFTTELHEFNDLSKILQQEISLVINNSIIRDTPLFSELEAYQISLITSNLSTRVLMPNEVVFNIGDVISEMYFINKGVVKMAKPIGNNQIQKYLLSDGEHFGEYGVMQFWRCDYSIKSITFTITHVLKKQVLENIIAIAPAIEFKLYLGQKLYKQEEQNQFFNNFKDLDIFVGLTETELTSLYINYMENVIVNPNEIIIVPDELISGLYIILDGKVQIYQENSKLLRVNVNNIANNYKESDIFYNSLDDFIYQKISQQQKVQPFQEIEDRVHFVGEIITGQYFGLIDHCTRRNLKNESFVLMSSQYSVKLGFLNQSIMQIIQEENKQLYDKLILNLQKIDKLIPNIQSTNNPESLKTINFLPNNTYLLGNNNGDGDGDGDGDVDDAEGDEEKDFEEFQDYDANIIRLREIVNHVQKELKDIQKKLRIVKPPRISLKNHK